MEEIYLPLILALLAVVASLAKDLMRSRSKPVFPKLPMSRDEWTHMYEAIDRIEQNQREGKDSTQ